MTKARDYHNYWTLSDYMDSVKSAGYSFPALLGWVVQSTMVRHDCTFQAAMEHLVRTGAIVLIAASGLTKGKRDSKTIDVKQRTKDLDAYSEEEDDRGNEKRTRKGEPQKEDGKNKEPEDIPG